METDNFTVCVDSSVMQNYLKMQELRQKNKFCDITLRAGEKSFLGHRIVLAGASPYFESRISNHKQDEVVSIKGIEPSVLETIINYAYGQEVRLNQENVHIFLLASSLLLMDKMREACVKFLISTLKRDNVVPIKTLAKSMNCNALNTATEEYIRKEFSKCAALEDFLSFEEKDMIAFIEPDDLNVENEEIVFETCISWVKHDEEQRASSLSTLLKHVRFPLLSLKYICNRVSMEKLVTSSPKCNDTLLKAFSFHNLPESRNQITQFQHSRRGFKEKKNQVKVNTPRADNVPIALETLSVGFLEEKLYIIWEDKSLPKVLNNNTFFCAYSERYNIAYYCPKTNKLQKIPQFPCTYSFGICILHEGRLYAFVKHSSQYFRFDPKQSYWVAVNCESMYFTPYKAAAVLNGKIYFCAYPNGLWSFDPSDNMCKPIASLNNGSENIFLTTCIGKLIAIGKIAGHYSKIFIETYDSMTDKWSTYYCTESFIS